MKKIRKSVFKHISISKRGFTLLELSIASVMLLLLLSLLFFSYYQSTNAMLKGTVQSDFLQSSQVLVKNLTKATKLAPPASVSLAADGSGLSLLSAENDQGVFQFDPALSVALWQKYLIFYRDTTTNEMRFTERSVVGFVEEANPGPIENWDAAQPIETYFTGGRLLASHITAAAFTQSSPQTITLQATFEQDRSHSQAPEKFTFEVTRALRN